MCRVATLSVLISILVFLIAGSGSTLAGDTKYETKFQTKIFKANPGPDVINFYNVDNVSIVNASVQASIIPFTEQQICDEALRIVQDAVKEKEVTVYGCKQQIPEPEKDNTLYMHIYILDGGAQIPIANRQLRPFVTIDIDKYRKHPLRSFPRMGPNYSTYGTATEEQEQMFLEGFSKQFKRLLLDGVQVIQYKEDKN